MKRLLTIFAALALALAFGDSARADGFLANIYVSGFENLVEDQDREAFVDVDASGSFSVGDVLVGWARMDDHSAPPGSFGPLGNRVYGIFSQEVAAINPTGGTHQVVFKPTTVAGLKLSDIVPGASASGFLAMFDRFAPFPTNLISTSPGNLTGSATVNIWDYFAAIQTASHLAYVAGIGNAGGLVGALGPTALLPDHFIARTTPTGSALIGSTAGIAGLGSGVTIAGFESGLSILQNFDTTVVYNRLVSATETALLPDGMGGFVLHDLSISGGTVKGSAGAVNVAEWSKIGPDNALTNPGGFITDADLSVNVTVLVPEPTSISLAAFGIAGLVVPYLRRKRLSTAA
jgi:hypothetical protein